MLFFSFSLSFYKGGAYVGRGPRVITVVCSPWRKGKQMACWPGVYWRRKQIASLGNPVPCPRKSRRPVLESQSLLRDLDTVSLQLVVKRFSCLAEIARYVSSPSVN